MSNERKRRCRIWMLLMIPILYALSAGPVQGLWAKGNVGPRMAIWFDYLYRPFYWCVESSETLTKIWNWYAGFWS